MAESHEMLSEYREKSMPHFMFYRNGVLKVGRPLHQYNTLVC